MAVIALVVIAGLTGALSLSAAGAAPPAPPEPTIKVESQVGAGGPVMMVVLDGWPMGSVNVSVCGADARRASQDCDNRSTQLAVISGSGSGAARLPALTPPTDCPCVVRAATPDSGVIKTVPVVIPGRRVMTPGEMPPDPNSARSVADLEVTAVIEGSTSLADTVGPTFGGPSERTLVLTFKNISASPLENLTASARVGAEGANGTPLALPAVTALAPLEQRTYRVPLTIPALTFGTYTASGKVSGLAAPVIFSAAATNRPTGLAVAAALLVSLWVALRWSRRSRRRRPESSVGAAKVDGT